MPIPPFHLVVGVLPKAVLGKRFSYCAFFGTQVLMDIEPGLKLFGFLDGPIHGFTHTWLGALLIGVLYLLLHWVWQRLGPRGIFEAARYARSSVIVGSVLFGVLSHVVLDAWMHQDMLIAGVSVQADVLTPDGGGREVPFSEFVSYVCFVLALAVLAGRVLVGACREVIEMITGKKA